MKSIILEFLYNHCLVFKAHENGLWFYGGIAQLGEHLPCKQGVMSSILIISTKAFNKSLKNTSWHNNINWYNKNSAVSVEIQTTAKFVPWELNNVIQRMRFKREFEIRFKKMRRHRNIYESMYFRKSNKGNMWKGEILETRKAVYVGNMQLLGN